MVMTAAEFSRKWLDNTEGFRIFTDMHIDRECMFPIRFRYEAAADLASLSSNDYAVVSCMFSLNAWKNLPVTKARIMLDENAIEQFEKELSELSRDAMERSNCKDGSAREGLEKLAKIVFSHLRERTPTPLEPSCGENSTISGIRDILDMQGVTTEARLRIIAKFIRALQS